MKQISHTLPIVLIFLCSLPLGAQPDPNTYKPWTYWWWMGSAVTKTEITRELEDFNRIGRWTLERFPTETGRSQPGVASGLSRRNPVGSESRFDYFLVAFFTGFFAAGLALVDLAAGLAVLQAIFLHGAFAVFFVAMSYGSFLWASIRCYDILPCAPDQGMSACTPE